jgi:hypothetical protein
LFLIFKEIDEISSGTFFIDFEAAAPGNSIQPTISPLAFMVTLF